MVEKEGAVEMDGGERRSIEKAKGLVVMEMEEKEVGLVEKEMGMAIRMVKVVELETAKMARVVKERVVKERRK